MTYLINSKKTHGRPASRGRQVNLNKTFVNPDTASWVTKTVNVSSNKKVFFQ